LFLIDGVQMHWQTTRYSIDLTQPRVMGIVNVTPDSFSDGGQFSQVKAALAHCETLVAQGADILDIGGESSRPGAARLTIEEEWQRLQPILPHALSLGVPISVDTCKPEIMRRALDLGVDIINDIDALASSAAQSLVVAHGRCGVCLMHKPPAPDQTPSEPATMQAMAIYGDVVQSVIEFLQSRVNCLVGQGVDSSRLILDPGVGFGKTPAHNLRLLQQQDALLCLGLPVLVGWSRKSTLGLLTGRPVGQRMAASVAAALLGIAKGARVVRVHDVAETVDAIRVWQAVDNPSPLSSTSQH
jgi:dihydropteroate synthase